MPDVFWLELEQAYNTVSVSPDLTVEISRGDKTGIIKYSPQMDCIFIKILNKMPEDTAVELNPAAKKEA